MFSPAPTEAQLEGLTFNTLSDSQRQENKTSYNWIDIVASLLIVLIVLWVMVFFSGK
jgi:solute:Na+ symporter, SSS family